MELSKLEIRELFGGFNDFPPNWKEISSYHYWNKWFTTSWSATDWRQMFNPLETLTEFHKTSMSMNPKSPVIARLFIYEDRTGLAISKGWTGKSYDIRFFEFGVCMHEEKETIASESRMCYHVSKCKNCGRKFTVDSSD